MRPFCWLLVAVQLSGCGSPSQRLDERAADLGYRKLVVQGDGFSHVAYLKKGHAPGNSALHVYLDGDGSPWARKRVAAADPTPRTALMLELMLLDPAPAVYLGRPCYHGLRPSACTPDMWTGKRYSEAVVASMSAALDRVAADDYQALVLVGYSGGGTLAMLLAERQPRTETVITVAANLDTQRWAESHRQQALSGSLNPARRPPLPARIRQMHHAGGRDDNVPPSLVRDAIAQQQGATFREFPQQDHSCCWHEVWPQILGTLTAD